MIKLLKQLFAKSDCPKCGWWIACDECSKRLDFNAFDEETDELHEHTEWDGDQYIRYHVCICGGNIFERE